MFSEKDSDLCYKERESTGVQQLYTRALRRLLRAVLMPIWTDFWGYRKAKDTFVLLSGGALLRLPPRGIEQECYISRAVCSKSAVRHKPRDIIRVPQEITLLYAHLFPWCPAALFRVRKIYVEWRKLSMRLFNVQHAFKFVSIHAAHLSMCLGFERAPERSWHAHIAELPRHIARLRWMPPTHGSHAYLCTSCPIQIRIYYLTLSTLE